MPWTRNQNFVPTELLRPVLLVLLVCCGLTHRLIEVPMQRLGRRVTTARRRFGPDTAATGPTERNETLVQPLAHWNPGFTASGTTVI